LTTPGRSAPETISRRSATPPTYRTAPPDLPDAPVDMPPTRF
jgi:hypothetical protein